jgi:Transposase DDE domain
MEGIAAAHLIADKGYDSDATVEQATSRGMNAVIPPRKNRTTQRRYDEELYNLRHLAFLHLKHWRGIATRYAKHAASFLRRHAHQVYRSLGGYLVTTLPKEALINSRFHLVGLQDTRNLSDRHLEL